VTESRHVAARKPWLKPGLTIDQRIDKGLHLLKPTPLPQESAADWSEWVHFNVRTAAEVFGSLKRWSNPSAEKKAWAEAARQLRLQRYKLATQPFARQRPGADEIAGLVQVERSVWAEIERDFDNLIAKLDAMAAAIAVGPAGANRREHIGGLKDFCVVFGKSTLGKLDPPPSSTRRQDFARRCETVFEIITGEDGSGKLHHALVEHATGSAERRKTYREGRRLAVRERERAERELKKKQAKKKKGRT
jgi:hypothetical protein